MKHNIKVTSILILMFLITQLIGIWVISVYNTPSVSLPYGMEPPEEVNTQSSIVSILFAFAIAITLMFFLTKINAEKFLRGWFFIVTVLAISLSLNVFLFKLNVFYSSFIAVIISLPLAYYKIFLRNLWIHNFTELLIYPGIASVFVPILNIIGIILLLFVISLYDIWAVWKSEFMAKMAKFQINNLKIFSGFFLPYAKKKDRIKIQKIKQKYKEKSEKVLEKEFKKARIRVSLAILGGGDIIFPIITAGIFLKTFGLISALIITLFATFGLLGLFLMARKEKFYPAMPFLSIAMYLGMIVDWFLIAFGII